MPSRIFSLSEHEAALELVPSFRDQFLAAADACNQACMQEDCEVMVESCFRSFARQQEAYAKGRKLVGTQWIEDGTGIVTRATPGRSPHQYRLAGHLVLRDAATGEWLQGGKVPDARWGRIVGRAAKVRGLVWGGDFRGLFDGCHVESPTWRAVAERYRWRGLPVDLDPAGVLLD